jgi:hypothetical protein
MRVLSSIALATLIAVSGCRGSDTIAGSSKAAVGTWTLSVYNGMPLPATAIQQGTTTVAVVSGSLDLGDDNTYHIFTTFRTVQNGVSTTSSQHVVGIWVDRGGNITLVPDGGAATVTATYSGSQLLLNGIGNDGGSLPLVYSRAP